MATNPYFNHLKQRNEQSLIEDLIIESIKLKGMDVIYLPRTLVNKDSILGEDPRSLFAKHKPIEMYVESVNGFEGEGDLLTKFGLQVNDNATFVVSKLRFQKETTMVRPLEGDIIFLPMSKGFFEIKFVEHESPFYQLGKNYVFKMTCELFEYSEEVFETGDEEIDTIIENIDYRMYLTITGGTGTFYNGQTVYQYSNGSITGGLSNADASGTLELISETEYGIENIKGTWLSTSDIITRYVTSISGDAYRQVLSKSDTVDNDDYNDNKDIQSSGEDILDFSEDNPFGDY